MTATKKTIPSKRIKTWHRQATPNLRALSLRAFARWLLKSPKSHDVEIATAWLTIKGAA